MKHLFLFFIGMFICELLCAQRIYLPKSDEVTHVSVPPPKNHQMDSSKSFYTIVDTMPEFPGGKAEMMQFLLACKYPDAAREEQLEDDIVIRFLIDENGLPIDISCMYEGHPILDSAAVECIAQMPQWTPGKKNGKPVKVQYIVPIRYKYTKRLKKKQAQ